MFTYLSPASDILELTLSLVDFAREKCRVLKYVEPGYAVPANIHSRQGWNTLLLFAVAGERARSDL